MRVDLSVCRGRKFEGTPRTRQSPLTLAAFRPWGSSQDRRRTGSNESVVPATAAIAGLWFGGRLPWPTEDSPSGLWRSPGTRVGLTPSGVQIPYPPHWSGVRSAEGQVALR